MPTSFSLASNSGQTRWCSRSYSSMASGLMRSLNAYRGISSLSIAGDRRHVLLAPFGGDLFEIAALPEGIHGVGRQPLGDGPLADHGADIGGEGVLEARFGIDQGATGLIPGELFVIHHGRLGEQFHGGADGLDHGFDLALEIVALIDHVGDIGALPD